MASRLPGETSPVTSPSTVMTSPTTGEADNAYNIVEISQFGVVDYAVFAVMVLASMSVGVYSAVRARRNPTVAEFMLGGRSMPAVPVALSLLGGVISALSILGNATEIYLYGTQLCINLLGSVFGVFIIQSFILPVFVQLNLITIVQYLEMRFESNLLRRLSSFCQMIPMFFYLGICLYAPSLALSSVTNLPTWGSILLLGIVCTFYVSIGGVRAVVYTDVVQTVLMFGGVLAVVVIVCVDVGGVGVVWNIADQGGRIQFFNMDPSPFTRHTFWSTGVLGMYFIITTVALSQAQYQRFASIRNVHQCKWLLKFFLVGLFLLWGMFYFSGLVAYAAYRDCDPLTSGRIDKPDQIIPYLVMDKLGAIPGLPGLFVAAVYGGVLSSMSSQANSIACLVWEDVLKDTRFFAGISEKAATTTVKVITAVTGLCSVGLAMLVGQLGTLFSVAYSISGAIQGPMDGLFIAGIFVPWANKTGAVVGLVTSFVLSLWRVIGKFIKEGQTATYLPLSTEGCPENYLNATTTTTTTTPLPGLDELPASPSLYDISYCYNGAIGILVTLLVTSAVSLVSRPLHPGALNPLLLNPTSCRLYRAMWTSLAKMGWASWTTEDRETNRTKEPPITLISVTTQTTLVMEAEELAEVEIRRVGGDLGGGKDGVGGTGEGGKEEEGQEEDRGRKDAVRNGVGRRKGGRDEEDEGGK